MHLHGALGRALARACRHLFEASARTIAAVRDLSFSINPGEVLGLVGESGSGKSITSLAIMGLLPTAAKSNRQNHIPERSRAAR